ncbi:MAG: hypothetical protein AAGC79_08890 [Pseudomonadota bacterium]
MDSQIRTITAVAFVLTSIVSPIQAQEPEPTLKILRQLRAECAGWANGVLEMKPGSLTQVELTGDDAPEEIIDSSRFQCSSAASLYCGTGGCSIWVIAEGKATSLLVKDWQVVDHFGTPVLLSRIHGSECGGDNTRLCMRAYVWSDGALQTVD